MCNFFKKIIFIIFLTTGLSNLIAQQHSFYLGTNVGINGLSGKRDDFVKSETPTQQYLAKRKSIDSQNVLGGTFAGYLFRFKNFGIGSELFLQYTNLENIINKTFDDTAGGTKVNFKIKHKLTTQLGINIKAGYFLCEYFTYALLGLQSQKITYNFDAVSDNFAGSLAQFRGGKSNYVKGINLGIGVQKSFSNNITAGLEFKVTKLPKTNFQFQLQDNLKSNLSSKLSATQTYSAAVRFCVYV